MKKISILLLISIFMTPLAFAVSVQEFEQSRQCKSVAFELPSNPTTGYRWRVLDYNKARFKKNKPQYKAAKTKRMGAGGKTQFSFSVREGYSLNKPAVILLSYGQAWNKSSAQKTVVIIQFTDKKC